MNENKTTKIIQCLRGFFEDCLRVMQTLLKYQVSSKLLASVVRTTTDSVKCYLINECQGFSILYFQFFHQYKADPHFPSSPYSTPLHSQTSQNTCLHLLSPSRISNSFYNPLLFCFLINHGNKGYSLVPSCHQIQRNF